MPAEWEWPIHDNHESHSERAALLQHMSEASDDLAVGFAYGPSLLISKCSSKVEYERVTRIQELARPHSQASLTRTMAESSDT